MDIQIKVESEERQFEDYQNQFDKIKFSNEINTAFKLAETEEARSIVSG